MKIIDMTCPHCGANLKIDSEKTVAYCEHCGAKLVIDDEVHHVKYDNAEQAGYEFEKGRQRAQAEAAQNGTNRVTYRVPVQQEPIKKRRTWLWVLGWIFFFPAPIMVLIWRKKNTWDIKVKVAVTIAFWIIFFAIGASNNEETEKTTTSSSDETSTEISEVGNEMTVSDVENSTEDTVSIEGSSKDLKAPLDLFFKTYIDSGRVETIDSLAEECGVFSYKKNTGTRHYYKIALTKDDAKAISLGDLTNGDYCIVIDGNGESLTYYNNIDLVEIYYSDESGYSIYDKSRLTPFEDGSMSLSVKTADEALAYEPSLETELSPIELFYIEATIGMTSDELQNLLDKYGLVKKYRRSNSDDGYISYGGVENNDYGTCIRFVIRETVSDLDYYDYYVQEKEGLHIEYINEDQASKRSGDYPEPGYYIVGNESVEFYDSAEAAIKDLHGYRTK